MKLEEADYDPKCPHCGKELEAIGVHRHEPTSFLGIKVHFSTMLIHSCPHCHKLLTVSSASD